MLRCSNFVHIKCLCFCGAPPPPAALAVARPRPPCVSTYGLGRGADLALGVRFLAHGVACCGVCRRCDKPPAPSALPPGGGLLVVGRAECEDMPPAPSALPPGVGRSRGFLDVSVLRWGALRSAVSFMRLPTRTSTAKSSPRSPPNLGAAPKACPRTLQNRRDAQNTSLAVSHPRGPPTDQSTPSLPPSRTK